MNDLEQRMAALEVAVGRLAALAAQASEPQSSVELSRNAKGDTQWVVKVYDADPDVACGTAQALFDGLATKYGPGGGVVSRFDYDGEEATPGQQNLWEANVKRALNGRKGQKMLREMEQALLALPTKRLIDSDFKEGGDVCVVGALAIQGIKNFLETDDYAIAYGGLPDFEGDPEEIATYAERHLGMGRLLAWHLQFKNDEEYAGLSPELRYDNMLQWVRSRIKAVPS